jgi:hypothetical protein
VREPPHKECGAVADATNKTVQKLADASGDIGKVMKARQPRLAMLARDMRSSPTRSMNLTRETAKAIENICPRIEAIQSETLGAVQAAGRARTS